MRPSDVVIFGLRAGFFLVIGLMVSCAPRGSQTPPPAATAVLPVEPKAPGQQSTRRVSVGEPAPAETELKSDGTVVTQVPRTRAERLATLVRSGKLVAESRDTATFVRAKPIPAVRASLYEEAILLGKLRRKLKDVPALPPSVVATATVQDSQACLKFSDEMALAPVAGAIDAALNAAGIASVQASFTGAAIRL